MSRVMTYVDIEDLTPYHNNPRNNEKAVAAVAESIREFGFKVPLVIDENGVIVTGHTRLKAAEKLGLKKVPCIIADDLTPEQIKAFRLADNKTAELAEWDFDKLEEELAALDFDMTDFGFDPPDADNGGEIVEDDPPEVNDERPPDTEPGDIYQLGRHRLICGDSTDHETLRRLTDGAEMDLVLTDPPYNADYEGKTKDALKIQNDNMTDANFYCFLFDTFKNLHAVTKPGGAVYIFHAHMESVNFLRAYKDADFYLHQMLVWNKNTMVLGHCDYQWKHEPIIYGWKPGAGHYFTNSRLEYTVIEDAPNVNKMTKEELREYVKELLKRGDPVTVISEDKPARNAEHPTMKPVKLVAYLIRNSSKAGENVIDVFGGSGSTLIAAEQTGRTCYTVELDPRYCDVIVKRWENLTGKKAVKL